ncbi:hypothetical protein ACIQ64_22185 [Streptomyces sp. NPDC094473]|uniref:WXG100-like domain-containing protein n=1 Tax=Streptomyces sp. NPDC094473 TaxID=3366068 RepID=UPI00380105C4
MQEIDFPEDVRKMLWVLLGEMPLQARENLAWNSRDLYLDLAKRVVELRGAIQQSVRNAGHALPEDVARGYTQGLSLLTGDGGVDRLQGFVDQLDDMARGQIDYSMKIQESKWEIIAEIVMLLIELAFLAALAFFTGGTSISQMALARARSRLALLMIIDRLLRMTHLAPALSEAFVEAIQTLAVKLTQIAVNPPGRRPSGIDWGDVGKAAAFGALGGVFGSVFGHFSNNFKSWFRNGGGQYLDHLKTDFPKRNPVLSRGLNDAYDVPAVFVVSGLSETLAEVLVTGLFDGTWEFKWETFVGSGTSGVFGMYAESAVGQGALWLNDKFLAPPVAPGRLNDPPRKGGTPGDGPGASTAPSTGPGAGPGPVMGRGLPLTMTPPATVPPPVTMPLPAVPPAFLSPAPEPPPVAPSPPVTKPVAPTASGTPTTPVPSTSLTSTPFATSSQTVDGPASTPAPMPSDSVRSGLSDTARLGSGASGPSWGSAPVSQRAVPPPLAETLLPPPESVSDDAMAAAEAIRPSAGPGAATGAPQRSAEATEMSGDDTEAALGREPSGAPATVPHVPVSSSPAASPDASPPPARRGPGVDRAGPADEPGRELPDHSGTTDAGTTDAGTTDAGTTRFGTADSETAITGAAPPSAPAVAPDSTSTALSVAPASPLPTTSAPGVPGPASPVPAPSTALPATTTPAYGPDTPAPSAASTPSSPDMRSAERQEPSGAAAPAGLGTPESPEASGRGALGPPAWEAARAGAVPEARSHTWVDPLSAPPDPQRPGQTTQFVVRSKFDVRRFEAGGELVTDLTVQVGVGRSGGLPEGVWEKVLSGVETVFNAPGHRLPNGDLLHVTVERVESDPHPNGLDVQIVGRDRQMTRSAWWADAHPVDYAHEISHMLGLRDESRHAVAPHRPDIGGSLLGDYRRPAPQGLVQGGLRGRHLDLIAAHIGDPPAVRPPTTGSTPATPAPAAAPAPITAPATASAPATATTSVTVPPSASRQATAGRAPGAEPYAPVLPGTRPPVLDRSLPRPLGGRREPVDFGNGTRMPAYIDDVGELIGDVPPGILLSLVSGGMTFGHSDVVLRGTGQALAEIGRVLAEGGDTVRPAPPGKGRSTGSALMDDVTYAFTHEPKTLAGDGRVFPYTARDGGVRKLAVTVRHYGDWEQFTDTYGSPVKVDGMHRSVAAAGQNKTMQSVTQLALGGPVGPVGAAAFSGFGRIGLRLGRTDRVGYGQTEQGTTQTETRSLDGSRVYLDHVYYELRVTDAEGRTVTGTAPALRGFAVRDGLSVRLPDSVTSTKAAPGRIPRSMELDRQSSYRLVRTEGFGPVSRMRDWAAQEIGVAPGSTAYGELNSFFSSLSFQRQSPALSRGRVTTVPLFADDKARTPLGVFVVDVVPGRATLITETADAEMRDINTLTVRNDRSLQKTAAVGIDGVAGPAFNFFDLADSTLNLRLQFGGAFRYLFSVSRTAGLGGSGAIKSAGQVKGDLTGLYLVRKTVHVQLSGSTTPPRQFHTWSVDRMTRTEARRLAGWDDGLRRASRTGAPEPFAPAYLTRDRPHTLGMHRVEEFAFDDGTRTGPPDPAGQRRTLLDTFADEVLTALAAAYPGLVARLHQLAPPERRTWRERTAALLGPSGSSAGARPLPSRWRDDDAYRTALANTLEVLTALSHRSMAGNLEALTTTGIRVRFVEPGRIGQGHRYIWLRGELTNRRFEGVQDDFKLRYSSVGVERVDGQKSSKRLGEAGVEGLLAFRDPMADDIGAPHNAGGPSAGVRWGWQSDDETGFGATATYEPMTVSAGPSHLYRYDLSLTVDRGGYWRFRGLLRGAATLGLLGTQPFVFRQPLDLLVGTTPGGRTVGGGPRTGQVLISIPSSHAPAVDPHGRGAVNPYTAVATQPVRTLRPDRARALALGDLSRPGSLVRAADLVGEAGPVTPDGRGSRMFRELQNHPFLTVGVVPSPALVAALGQVMASGSGGAWQLTEEGAPTREAVLRAFQAQYLTANFDQSSGPLGWSASGLMGKGPYATLWANFRHLTAVDGVRALTGAVPMDTEMVLGGSGQSTGKLTRTRTFFTGGQIVYARSHATGPGLLGTYGLVASPWSTADQTSRTVARSFVHDMNRKGFGHQVLVSGTAEHWLALTSSLLGSKAAGRPLVPDRLAAAAGRMTTVPGGWLAHVPEKSAHLVGLIEDGMGEVPRYTQARWSPQPWLRENNFGTYAVNALDPSAVLAAFERRVAALGLDDAGRERVRTLVSSRVLRSLDKEMTGGGASIPARTGAWGWHSIRLGRRQIRIRVQLVPGEAAFTMLDHSVEMEENRRAIETVTEGAESTKGADFGYLVGEAVHTENSTAVAAGPTFTETGSGRKSSGESRTESTLTVFRVASTEPHAEIATPYTLRITLEADDPPPEGRGTVRTGFDRFRGKQVLTEEGPAGTLREHVPLSLMAPDTDPGADLLEAPDLTALAAPRQDVSPYVLGPDTLHGDGSLKPFRFPDTGFDVRRIVGLADIQVANTYALALSYDAGFSMDGPDAPRRARDTGLTRLGTGSAQALEDGTGNAALTAYYHRATTPQGYGIPGLSEKNIVGDERAQLDLYAKPDFSRARLLTVADGKKMEMLRRTGAGAAATVGRENAQDSALGAGVLISSDKTGLHQLGGSGTGPYAAEGDALPTSADQLTSINTKPKTGRVFLFAVPTSWLSVADVRRGVKDTRVGRFVGGTFGRVRPGPKAVSSQAYALVWVRDDVARELGLIDDTNFPARVGAAWDAVGSASKAWVDADKAYWKKRRAAIGLREERDAARITLAEAERAAEADGRRLAAAGRAAEGPRNTLAEATAHRNEVREQVGAARTELDALVESAGEVAHDGWADLMREQIMAARGTLVASEARLRAAEARMAALRGPAEEAGRAVRRAEEEVAAAALRVATAARRRDAAVSAFDNRRALLDALRTTAETAAAEYHRVRAATDQLTRWHQEAATAEGRARLAGRPEPPAVSHRKPAAAPPPPEPSAATRPPVYTRTGTGEGSRLTSPDHVTYAVHEVPEDGDAFLHALVEGLSRSAPDLLTDRGVDLADRRAAVDTVRRALAARLMDPSDADLLDAVAPDITDTFSDAEATGAGLRGSGPLGENTPGGREFDGLGGLIPYSVNLGPEARAALAVAQLTRPGNMEGEAGWDQGAADLLPVLAARTFDVDITVVDGEGRFQDFGPGPSDPTGHLAGSLDVRAGGPRPRVVLSLVGRHYQLAVREAAVEVTDEPGAETGATSAKTAEAAKPTVDVVDPAGGTDGSETGVSRTGPRSDRPKHGRTTDERGPGQTPPAPPSPPFSPAPLPSGAAARGRPVRVPGTGECLFFALIAGDPAHVRSRLPGLAESHPDAYAWLGDVSGVRADLSSRAVVRSASRYEPGGPETAVVSAMREAVRTYLTASEGRLPHAVTGQLRLSTVTEFGQRIARLHRAGLVPLLAHHGVDADTLADRSEAGLRAELAAVYPTSTAPLDTVETYAALDAVSHWEDRYMTDVGEIFLPLLAHAFEARIEVAWNGRLADTRRVGPSGASRVIEVHYNGRDHYDGSTAEPTDLLVFGETVAPKRVKPEERDAVGDVRVNPLWTPLDEIDPALLITGNRDAVWIYTVNAEGRVLLGSERPSAIVTPEQFEALPAGMRRVAPDLTADELRDDLDGLGHTGIAARFGESGRSHTGMSRISGEFRWSQKLERWTVNDKSGRYMSGAVRPGLDPAVAAGWLGEVAGLFTERLGVRVVPEQVKTASAGPPGAPPPPPPPVVPVKGMVSLAELAAVGVTLSLSQATQAALLGDKLPVAELGLTSEQHRLVRVQRGEPDTSGAVHPLLD